MPRQAANARMRFAMANLILYGTLFREFREPKNKRHRENKIPYRIGLSPIIIISLIKKPYNKGIPRTMSKKPYNKWMYYRAIINGFIIEVKAL